MPIWSDPVVTPLPEAAVSRGRGKQKVLCRTIDCFKEGRSSTAPKMRRNPTRARNRKHIASLKLVKLHDLNATPQKKLALENLLIKLQMKHIYFPKKLDHRIL